jgi:hypothetical protein
MAMADALKFPGNSLKKHSDERNLLDEWKARPYISSSLAIKMARVCVQEAFVAGIDAALSLSSWILMNHYFTCYKK